MIQINRERVRLAAIFVPVWLTIMGCAGFGKPLEQPRINLANIEVEEMTGLETAFLVQLRVFNTNDRALQVTGIECDLDFNGQRFATGVSKVSVDIPSYGSELVSITVYTTVLSMFRSMMSLQQHQHLSYRLEGKLRLNQESMLLPTLPFKSEGRLSLEDITPRKTP